MPSRERKAGLPIMIKTPCRPIGAVVARLARRRCPQCACVMRIFMAGRAGHPFCRKTLVRMAGAALLLGVFAQQGKARQRVIKADIHRPTRSIMAALTITAQLPRMGIILGVARATLAGQLDLIGRLNMACFAAHLGMFADQREIRHAIMVEVDGFPSRCRMASTAIRAISALMDVIRFMAVCTGGRGLDGLCRLLVTGRAGGRAMRAAQRKSRNRIVIETDLLPITGGMAGGALSAILTFMGIFFCMAGRAGAGRVLVDIAGAMAGRTAGCCMSPHQRKPRACVVKSDSAPRGRAMTTGTIGPATAFMGIVLCMAGDAGLA